VGGNHLGVFARKRVTQTPSSIQDEPRRRTLKLLPSFLVGDQETKHTGEVVLEPTGLAVFVGTRGGLGSGDADRGRRLDQKAPMEKKEKKRVPVHHKRRSLQRSKA